MESSADSEVALLLECPLCFEEMNMDLPLAVLYPCEHWYHPECLERWSNWDNGGQKNDGNGNKDCSRCAAPSVRREVRLVPAVMRGVVQEARATREAKKLQEAERKRLEELNRVLAEERIVERRELEAAQAIIKQKEADIQKQIAHLGMIREDFRVTQEKNSQHQLRKENDIRVLQEKISQLEHAKQGDAKTVEELKVARDLKERLEQERAEEKARNEAEKARYDGLLAEMEEKIKGLELQKQRLAEVQPLGSNESGGVLPIVGHVAGATALFLWDAMKGSYQQLWSSLFSGKERSVLWRHMSSFQRQEQLGGRYDGLVCRAIDKDAVAIHVAAQVGNEEDNNNNNNNVNVNVNYNNKKKVESGILKGGDRSVALKSCRSLREPLLLHTLQHPHILPLIGLVEEGGRLSLVLPFVPLDLAHLLSCSQQEGGLRRSEPGLVKRVFKNVVCAVAYIHRHQVIHRSLSPAAILLDAKQSGDSVRVCSWSESCSLLARVPLLSGTHNRRYHSPEYSLLGDSGVQDWKAFDMWSLGAMLVEMLMEKSELGLIRREVSQPQQLLSSLCEWREIHSDASVWLSANPKNPNVNLLRVVMQNAALPSRSLNEELTQGKFVGELGVRLVTELLSWEVRTRLTSANALLHDFLSDAGECASGVDLSRPELLADVEGWSKRLQPPPQ